MRTTGMVAAAVFCLTMTAYADDSQALKTKTDRESYGIGVSLVRKLIKQGGSYNLDLVLQGVKDGVTGQNLLMSEDEINNAIAEQETERDRTAAAQDSIIKTGDAGSAKNPANEGQDSGTGVGQMPAATEEPVELGGRLTPDGTVISKRNQAKPNVQSMKTGDAGSAKNPANEGQDSGTEVGQMPAATEEPVALGGRLTPDGTVISKRNQAKLNVQSMKMEMREKAITGTSVNN